jgi:DNA-binding XRE family transcriptional regulator
VAGYIEPFYAEVGRRIRDRRTKAGLTQEELGRLLSPPTTRVSVANIEAGKQRILSHTLVQLADALQAQLAELLPPKTERIPQSGTPEIAEELASKLGISKQIATEIAKKTKAAPKSKTP